MVEAKTYREAPVADVGPSPRPSTKEGEPLATGGANWLADPPRRSVYRSLSRSLTLRLLCHSYLGRAVAAAGGKRHSASVTCAVREWGRHGRRSIKGGTYGPTWRQFTRKTLCPALAVCAIQLGFVAHFGACVGLVFLLTASLFADSLRQTQSIDSRIETEVNAKFAKSEFRSARNAAEQILSELLTKKSKEAPSPEEKRNIPYLAMVSGLCSVYLNELKSAHEAYTKGYALAQELGDSKAMGQGASGLGIVLEAQGKFREALRQYSQAMEATKAIAGSLCEKSGVTLEVRVDSKKNPDLYKTVLSLATIHRSLGQLHRVLGEFREAKVELEEALRIRVLNDTGLYIAKSYADIGLLHLAQGNFTAAKEFYDRAIEVLPTADKDNPFHALLKNELGYVQFQLGSLSDAWAQEKQAEELAARLVKQNRSTLGAVLVNQGILLQLSGNPNAALPPLLKSLEIRQQIDDRSRDTLSTLSNLGTVYTALHRYAEAEEALLKVKSVYLSIKSDERRALAPFEYGRVRSRLGALAFILRRPWDQVFRDYHEGLHTLSSAVGDTFHFTTEIRTQLGIVEAVASHEGHIEWMTAWNDLVKGSRNYLDFLSPILAAGTEREHRTILARERRGLDQLLSLAEDRAKDLTPVQLSGLFAVVLSYQAASSRILSARNESAFLGDNPKVRVLHDQLTAARRRLSHLLLSGSRELDSGNVVKDYQRIESELSRETKGYQTLKLFFEAGPQELVPALPEDSALIEFIRFKRANFQGDRQKLLQGEEGEDYYSVFILSHRGLKLVSLGPAKAIDNAIANWREQAIGREKQDPREENAVLLKIMWGPVEAALPGAIQDLRVVPDGQLALLPFEAIRRPGGEYVVERYRISYLATGRNLLSQREKRESRGPFVIVGDPDYEAVPGSVSGPQGRHEIPDDEFLPHLSSFPAEARLVRDEIRARHSQDEIQLIVGADASEESVGKLNGPLRLLYFVTHGSYLKKAKPPPVAPEDADNPLLVAASTEGEEGQVRSVLALAGANAYSRRLASNLSDGRLTALEVEGLPIQPDLVVLSLCESATGKVIAGEDVMGLRHAFELAGARTVIGSLWTVPDESTKKLMEQFLRHWLDGMPKAEALRQAKLARLRDVKAMSFDRQSAAPVDWAGFIVHGEPQ
jgi:CHAT domain-containing protein/tetratricopeptide (TPR) repeat protein